MRLLNTWTGMFEWHDPKEVRYAILSHVWRTPGEGGEQTFDDVRRIQVDAEAAREEPGGPNPTHWPQAPIFDFDTINEPFPNVPSEVFCDLTFPETLYAFLPDSVSVIFSVESPLSEKIKGLCKVARDAGFDLVWNDTCCIDKSSSAELSEAINSMYEWYRLSDMCYAYLSDVPDGDIPQDKKFCFVESRWHARGWTLQELLAPERIEFLTHSWRFFGTKLGLAGTLARITSIDIDILLGRAAVDSASVAQRMSWAAERETTRIEDRAYSLLGLFGVHMSPIYGEGKNAFLRLQEEVIRTIPDQSIFAWQWTPYYEHCDDTYIGSCLLASSPTSFISSTVRPTTLSEFASRLNLRGPEEVPPLDCTFAPQGVRIQLLCVNLMEVRQHIPSLQHPHSQCCVANQGLRREPDRLALLRCEDEHGRLVGLAFHSSDIAGDGLGSLLGTRCNCYDEDRSFRIVRLSRKELAKILEVVTPETAEVSLLRHRAITPPSKLLFPIDSLPALDLWLEDGQVEWPALGLFPDSDRPRVPFSLSPDSVANLRTLGFTTFPLEVARGSTLIILKTALSSYTDRYLSFIPLRLSLELLRGPGGRPSPTVRFCFELSNAPLLPPRALAHSSTATSLLDCNQEQIKEASGYDVKRCYKLCQFDLLIPPNPYPGRPQKARLLRLSLERAPKGRQPSARDSSSTVFLVIDISEEHEHIDKSSIPDSPTGDSARPLSRTSLLGVGFQSRYATTRRRTALEERVDALERENSALCAQMSAATSQLAEVKFEVAALARQNTSLASRNTATTRQNAVLASQNAALASQNAALNAQMAAVWQRLDALTAATSKQWVSSIPFTSSSLRDAAILSRTGAQLSAPASRRR